MPFGPLRSTRLLAARSYYTRLTLLWMYSVAWASTVVLLALHWEGVSTLMKFGLIPLLVLGTPSVSDLFQTHTEYTAKWERDNSVGGRSEQ